MATKLQIKRTQTANLPGAGIESGEMVYVYDTGGGSSGYGNHGQRLYIGGYAGTSATPIVVGGKYFTDMLDHVKGTLTAGSAIVTDSNNKINQLYVSDLQLYSNKLVSTTTNTDIEISPNNDGRTIIDNLYVNVSSTATSIQEVIEDTVGGQIVTNGAHTGITAVYDDANDGAIDLSLEDITTGNGGNLSTGQFGGAAAVPVITVDAYGRITAISTAAISTTLTVENSTDGNSATLVVGSTNLTFTEGTGIDITIGGAGSTLTGITVAGVNAGTGSGSGTKGVASFDSADFSASSGHITIATGGVSNDQLAGSIANSKLTNSKIVLGNTDVNLGDTVTTLSDFTSIATTNFTISGTTIANASTTAGTTFTTANNTDISLEPNGNGVVKVPSGYETRTSFDDDSLVNKKYVDAVATGLDVKEAVVVATTAALDFTPTYSNANGTLTASSNGKLTIDGYDVQLGERVLVKDQADATENGIYTLTTVGAAGATAYVLTRAPDADTAAELSGGTFFFVERGNNLSDTGFVATHNGVPTFGTTDITFEQFSGAGQISAGAALTKDGNTLNVEVDDSTIEVSSDALQLKDLGITNAKISASAAIDQSKLNMTAATTRANATGIAQSDLGLASFDSNQFTLTNGWATVTTIDGGVYS